MKKAIVLLLMCISITVLYAQKPITGTWEGKLNVGNTSLRMVFHFDKQSDGSYKGTMDSPDQGALGIACDNVMVKGDSIIVGVKVANGGFNGLRINDSTINGNWLQGGMGIPVILKRDKDIPKASPPKVTEQLKAINGIWEGKLMVSGTSLSVVFHFDKNSDGIYSGSMDSPDQGVNNIHCDSVKLKDDSVIVKINVAHAAFYGLGIDDSTINGSWEQGLAKFSLTLKKVKTETKGPNRPQTPVPPFSYNSEDVEYDNADKNIHYGATFTYPKGTGPFPTAILITGSGQQDRDETIFGHKPFAVIADYLTKRGYAVLRVDDRGMGKSTGDVMNATSADFAKDVEVGLAYLRTRKEVDKKRMGMIGHSEGGLIASIVAAGNPDIDFVIMLAGPGETGANVLLEQSVKIMEMDSVPVDAATAYGVIYKKVEEDIMAPKNDTTDLYTEILADFSQWRKSQPTSILNALKVNTDGSDDKKITMEYVKGFALPWIKYFLKADPQPLIEKFTCKVLAIDGSKDIQVIEPINLNAINTALKKSKSPEYETKLIPGLNHLFQHCKTCTVDEYGQIEETFAPEALQIMGDWLDKNVKK
jgi:uncharacterized protein